MKFYDYFTRIERINEGIKMAKELGWNGIVVSIPYTSENLEKLKAEKTDFDLIIAAEIDIAGLKNPKKTLRKLRRKFEILIGRGGTAEVNRKIVEMPEFDILVNHVIDKEKCGINHVLARLARKNNVAICFDFHSVLTSYGKTRAKLFSALVETAKIVKKYNSPFVISSGAISEWDLRSPHDLGVFGKVLGLPEDKIKHWLSEKLIEENRKRLTEKWIMPGVEIE